MKLTVVFVVALFGIASAGYHSGHGSYGGRSSSYNQIANNGLRSVAEGSANQANSAVAQQHAAAQQASFQAKTTLAQQATQAAATANAALAGKTVLKQNLEQQLAEAVAAYEQEEVQLEIAQQSASAATLAAQQAQNQVNSLVIIKNSAEEVLRTTQAAIQAISSFLSYQNNTGGQQRLEALRAQLEAVRADYAATKDAADKAALAAQAARNNADAAAAQAATELESTSAGSYSGYGHEQEYVEVSKKWQ